MLKSESLSLKIFDGYQGKEINSLAISEEIEGKQAKFIGAALNEGFFLYEQFIQNALSNTHSFFPFLEQFSIYHTRALNGQLYFDSPESFYNDQNRLFQILHASASADPLKLFGEFILGLVRFDLACQLQYQVLLSMSIRLPEFHEIVPSGTSFFQRLNNLGEFQDRVKKCLTTNYVNSNRETVFWQEIAEWVAKRPKIDQFTQFLVSLHYIPDEPQFVTLAQVLHWKGWGGDGDILLPHLAWRCPNLLRHCIGYISHAATSNFTQIIANVVAPLSAYSTRVIENYVALMPVTSQINFLDLGSGPNSTMVKTVITNLHQKNYQIKLDAYDICALDPTKGIDRKIYYVDANQLFRNVMIVKYDIICVGYVLHQLINIKKVLHQLIDAANDGALIMNLEIKAGARIQFAAVPLNLVDREGYAPDLHFSEMALPADARGLVKFAYPLSSLDRNLPDGLSAVMGDPIWAARAFIVVQLSSTDYKNFQQLWNNEGPPACDQYLLEKNYRILGAGSLALI